MRLTHSSVRRSGVTSRYWSPGTDEVDLSSTPRSLSVRFHIDSKGGGQTEIELNVRPKDFPALLRAMSDTNREATIHAVGEELARQIAEQPQRDRRLANYVRQNLIDLAKEKYETAGAGEDHEAKALFYGIRRLIEEQIRNEERSAA
jgi:hypothetical protein